MSDADRILRTLQEAAILREAAEPDADGLDDAAPGELEGLRDIAARLEAIAMQGGADG